MDNTEKDILVMSRAKARSFSYRAFIPDTAIISIVDVNANDNLFAVNEQIKGVCRLRFDDEEKGHMHCITDADAKKIAAFVKEMLPKVELFIVHCEAGISRSSGVAAAIMRYLTDDDSQIFNDRKYVPNMTCYRMVLNELMEE